MRRRAFLDYADAARSRLITRTQRVVNPVSAGVIIGDGPTAAVLEVTAFADGRWELVSRQLEQSFGEIIAHGSADHLTLSADRRMLLAGIRCADEVTNGDHSLVLRFDRPTERDELRKLVDAERAGTRAVQS